MKSTTLRAQVASSFTLLGLLVVTCSGQISFVGGVYRYGLVAEGTVVEQDRMYRSGMKERDVPSLISPGSTESTESTFSLTTSKSSLSAISTLLVGPLTTDLSSDMGGSLTSAAAGSFSSGSGPYDPTTSSSSYGQTTTVTSEQSIKSFGKTTASTSHGSSTTTLLGEASTSGGTVVTTSTSISTETSLSMTTSLDVTTSTSTSVILTSLPQSTNFTLHNSFSTSTLTPTETSTGLQNVTSVSTLSSVATLTFTSQLQNLTTSTSTSLVPHVSTITSAVESFNITTLVSTSTSTLQDVSSANDSESTTYVTASAPWPVLNSTLVTGPTAITLTGTGVSKKPSSTTTKTVTEIKSTIFTILPLPPTSRASTTVTIPFIVPPFISNITSIPLVTSTETGNLSTSLVSFTALPLPTVISSSSSTSALYPTSNFTTAIQPSTASHALNSTLSVTLTFTSTVKPPQSSSPYSTSSLTSFVLSSGAGVTRSTSVVAISAHPIPSANISALQTPFPNITVTITSIKPLTANTSCLTTQTSTETDTWLFISSTTTTETWMVADSTTKTIKETSVTVVTSTETAQWRGNETTMTKHNVTSTAVPVSTTTSLLTSTSHSTSTSIELTTSTASGPIFTIETSMPASTPKHAFSSPSWLIVSPDRTTFITETSCISGLSAVASETSGDAQTEQNYGGPVPTGMIGFAGSEPSDVAGKKPVQSETWGQRIKRKVDNALESFGYGGRTTGDGWP